MANRIRISSASVAACLCLVLSVPQASHAAESRAERNNSVVLAFYKADLNRESFAVASRYLGDNYTQHNPGAADGREGFAQFVEYLRANYPASHSSVRQIFVDGDFVILHVLEKLQPADRGSAIVDTFRLKKQKDRRTLGR